MENLSGIHPALQELITRFEDIREKCIKLTTSITGEQANWHPENNRWSILDCLSHLNISGNLYLEKIRKATGKLPDNRIPNSQKVRFGFIANYIFIKQLEPPVKYKLRAPKKFRPETIHSKEETIEEFLMMQSRFIKQIRKAGSLNFAKIKITSPVSSLIRISLYDAFGINVAHERRHIWQIEQIKKSANFPRKN